MKTKEVIILNTRLAPRCDKAFAAMDLSEDFLSLIHACRGAFSVQFPVQKS